MNILLLWAAAAERNYPTHGWMTFRQANALGGHVKKGEKATTVVYTKFKDRAEEGAEKPKLVPMLKTYSVFNLVQLEGLPANYLTPPEPWPEDARLDALKKLVESSGIKVQYGAAQPVYMPGPDVVELPDYGSFKSDDDFASTLGHEMAHATGHPSRLNRKFNGKMFKEAYAAEECVAELASAFLCAHLGFSYTEAQSPAYIESWLKVLKQDNRAIFSLASYASHAADWLREREHAVTAETPDCEKSPREGEEIAA
jgi:antirestriction protein ArdC